MREVPKAKGSKEQPAMSRSNADALTGARTMWELVDRRATASPDHPMLIAADG
jgi:hypothetical protein